jgi:hypothetical protein
MIVCLISLCYLNNLLMHGKGLLVLEVRLLPTSDCLAPPGFERADLSFNNSCLTSKTFSVSLLNFI